MRLVLEILKWTGLTGLMVLLLLFAFGTRRAITWTSQSLEYQVTVMLGAVNFAWRPEGWSLADDPYAGQAGWSVARYLGATWIWWVRPGALGTWEWVTVPLWLPTLFLGLPTGVLWYRDRRATRQAFRRAIAQIRPIRRKHVSFWMVVAFSVLHGICAMLLMITAVQLCDFFSPPQPGTRRLIDSVVEWSRPCVIWATPLWGVLWAWLCVRVSNQVARRSPANRCFECGYDLTGNVSGRCPECGKVIHDKSTG